METTVIKTVDQIQLDHITPTLATTTTTDILQTTVTRLVNPVTLHKVIVRILRKPTIPENRTIQKGLITTAAESRTQKS